MKILVVSPRLAVQKADVLGSGVPYWPVELAVFAQAAEETGDSVTVIDAFGLEPWTFEEHGDHYLQGLPTTSWIDRDEVRDANLIVLFAISAMSYAETLRVVRSVRHARRSVQIAVMENPQAVTAFSVSRMEAELFEAGADLLFLGTIVQGWREIRSWLADSRSEPPVGVRLPTATGSPQRATGSRVMCRPIPAWDKFPIGNYWRLPYSHGPKTATYLPLLTSLGCPYLCDFCVIPETNARRWHPRPVEEVVDEVLFLRDKFGVHDFHIEDVNPTVSSKRWAELCAQLIAREAGIRLFIVSGTKAETVRLEDVPLLAAAGVKYLSISPESGSPRILRAIGKPFDHEHGLALVERCRTHGIVTQACFLVGHPAERRSDHELSINYLKELVRAGVGEVAIFGVSPLPGSSLFDDSRIPLSDPAALWSFSPRGRADWSDVSRRRRDLIWIFFFEMLRRGPDLWAAAVRSIFGRPASKLENVPRRLAFLWWHIVILKVRAVAGVRRQRAA